MSGIMKSSLFFTKKVGSYSDGWGEVTGEDRTWEQSYRDRWAHDKIVRSTARALAAGRFTLKTESSFGKLRKRIIPPPPQVCRITSPAVAPEAPAIPGTSTLHPE